MTTPKRDASKAARLLRSRRPQRTCEASPVLTLRSAKVQEKAEVNLAAEVCRRQLPLRIKAWPPGRVYNHPARVEIRVGTSAFA
jgi:hypothetical protein